MTVKKRIANVLRNVLPDQAYRELETRYGRRATVRWLRREGVLDLALKVANQFDYTVQGGLFGGMQYTRAAVLTRHATPNLLGTYERQLYPLLQEAAIRCDFIVDIGSAEGYFAVGLARLTKKPVIAFDVNGSERQIVREMAALNQVSHLVTISDWCSSARLMDLVSGKRALVFCDIDGGEFSLFTSDTVRALNLCDAFIELHGTPQENRGFIDRFVGREPIILDHPKESAGAERLALLGKDARRMSVEYRDPQQWLVLRPGDLSSLEQLREHLGSSASSLETTAARSRLQSEEVMLASSAGYIAGKTTTGRSASR
jgi:hypothetical protein